MIIVETSVLNLIDVGSVSEDGILSIRNTATERFIFRSNGQLAMKGRSTTMAGKQERRMDMFFASFDGDDWEVLGRDNEDLAKELNPDTETSKNVLGESTFKHNGYEPEVSVDPYYADKTSPLYEKLLAAAVQEKYGDADIKGYFTEVVYDQVNEKAGTLSGTGYKREAYIVPQSTGGDTSGFSIPFTVNPVGAMTKVNVVYTIATRAVSITPVVA